VTLQGSDDGSTWVELLAVSDLPKSNDQLTYPLANSTAYKYYRFVCDNTSGTAYYTGLGKVKLALDYSGASS
jgi:hypothetical protein